MKNFLKKRKFNILMSAAAILFMWLIWIIAYFAAGNPLVVPSFTEAVKSFFSLLASGSFWSSLGYTVLTTFIAFALSFALGGLLAALSLTVKGARAFLKPIIGFMRTLPTLAVILILLVWTTPRFAPVIVTVLVLLPLIYAQINASFGQIDEGLKQMLSTYGVDKKTRFFKVYLPLASPNVLSQIGADFSLGLKVMISAEVLASTRYSFGVLMQDARLYTDMPRLAALTLAAVAIGFIFDISLSQLAKINDRWQDKNGL